MPRNATPSPIGPTPHPHARSSRGLVIYLVAALSVAMGIGSSGCAAARPLSAELAPMDAFASPAPRPKVLKHNRFKSDKVATISEAHMREILDAPVFLEEAARIGIVRVAGRYRVDADVPTHTITDLLRQELQATGLLDDVTEVTTDWPASSGIPGLRELAARYRCEYLVLYRHRFVDRSYNNGWTALALTVVGAFFAPMHTIETAGVLEVTLFEVKTGTLLFTSYERVSATSEENIYQNDRKRGALKTALMSDASKKLAGRLVDHTRRLATLRPEPATQQPAAALPKGKLAQPAALTTTP